MNNNKAIVITVGAVVALLTLSFVVRFLMLSEYGVSGGWIYYGLPLGGIGVVVLMLRLGLLNFGERSSRPIQPLQYHSGAYPPAPAAPQPVASVSQRLQELDGMRSSGAISEAEYNAKREQIISTI
jgi:hypothetical protein